MILSNMRMESSRALSVGRHWTLPVLLVLAASAHAQPVPTVVVQSRTVGSAYELDGVIQAVKQSTISAQASGRVVTLLVKAGDKVHAGQLLATLDDREAVVGAQKSQAQINQAQAELHNAQAHLERTRDLQGKGFVSKAALDTADTQYKGAVAGHAQAQAAARQSSISQGFTKVTAPYDGWVLQTHIQAGDLAVPGAPVVTVYAPQPLRAVVQVPGSRSQAVSAAASTAVQMQDGQGRELWVAPLNRLAVPSADPVSQTTEWRMELPSKDSAGLLPGQQVRVRFSQPQVGTTSKLMLPQAAIVRRGELTAVYLVSGKGFALRAVRLGASLGADGVEALAGVAPGDVVALDPIRAGFANAVPAAAAK